MKERHLPTVNWKLYFDKNDNPRAKKFLETRGFDLFNQIGHTIVKAKKAHKREVIFLAHPNALSLVSIPENEYDDFLNIALEWFQANENYEECSKVVRWKKRLKEIDKVSSLS